MSDNEDALAVLRNPEILAVKHLPLDVVPQAIKRTDDDGERAPFIVREKPFDVLKEQKAWSFGFDNPSDVKEERTARVFESEALPCDRK